MAMFKILFLISLCILTINGQSSLKEVNCGCDLTLDYCDLLCCCDNDCEENDKLAFNCRNETNLVSRKYCIRKGDFYSSNTPYILKEIGHLVCVEREIEEKFPEDLAKYPLTEEALDGLVNQATSLPIRSNLEYLNEDLEFFTTLDRMWIVSADNKISYFNIPYQSKTNVLQKSGLPVNYLVGKKNMLKYLQENDWITSNLMLKEFYSFKLIPKPNSLRDCRNQLNLNESIDYFNLCTNLIKIEPLIFFTDGTEICVENCDITTLPSEQLNSLAEINYLIEYNNPDGLSKAVIKFEILNNPVKLSSRVDVPVGQLTIDVSFFKNIDNIDLVQRLSGNPGYQKGEPVVAAYWNSTFLEVPTNRDVRFTVMLPNVKCRQDALSRSSIKFGKNIATDCTYTIPNQNNQNLETMCNELQSTIIQIILGDSDLVFRPNYVATFGNLIDSKDNTDDFVDILYPLPTNKITTDIDNKCNDISNRLSIQIAYAFVGNELNRQAKIVKVIYNWNDTITYRFKCLNKPCDDKITVSTHVTFVDVSISPTKTQARLFDVKPIIPYEFFSPFSFVNSAPQSPSPLIFKNNANFFIFFLYIVVLFKILF